MDLQKYWNDVRAEMANLPHERVFYLVSVDNSDKGITGGRVMDLSDPKQVARRIVERTHILATRAQIAAHLATQQEQSDELDAIELKRKGNLAMPKELQDLVRLATRNVAADQPQPTPAPPAKPKEK